MEQSTLINITKDGGLTKRILVEGSGELPPKGASVQICYDGRISETKEVFDTAHSRLSADKSNTFAFTLGTGSVIPCLDEAVKSMKKGEVALVTAKPEYAYGRLGCPPRIPGNVDLEFEIELVSFEPPKETKLEFASLDDRIKAAEKDRVEGNEAFKLQQYRKASRAYNKALAYFNGLTKLSPEDSTKVSAAKTPLHLNLSVCYLKLEEVSKSIKHAEKAIELDDSNAKGYFRLGQAFDAIDNLSLAHANFYRAAQLNPNDKGIRQEIDKVKQKIEAEKVLRSKDNMFVGMFSKKKE